MFTAPYEEVECPKCYGHNDHCYLCKGTNQVDPDEALSYDLDHRESWEEDQDVYDN